MTPKNILILSDSRFVHTKKWCEELIKADHNVFVFSLFWKEDVWYKEKGIEVSSHYKTEDISLIKKLFYLFAIKKIKKIIKQNNIDYVNAHYASSYGLLGALSKSTKLFLSFWGTDVFVFPKKSFLHKQIIKYVVKKADEIFSSSIVMAKEIEKYTPKQVINIPFGVDLDFYKPSDIKRVDKVVNLGIVKTLEPIYCIDVAIQALISLNKLADYKFHLFICGKGSLEEELKKMAPANVTFLGEIEQDEVPGFINTLDVFINPTQFESFGVSTVEAMACGIPVIAHNSGGSKEIIDDNHTGILYKPNKPKILENKILELIGDKKLKEKLIVNAKAEVREKYDLKSNSLKFVNFFK